MTTHGRRANGFPGRIHRRNTGVGTAGRRMVRWVTPERGKYRRVTAAGHGAQTGTGASEGEKMRTVSTTEGLPSGDMAAVTGVTIGIAMEGLDITSAVRGTIGMLGTHDARRDQAATNGIVQETEIGLVNVTALGRVSAVGSETGIVIVRETVMAHRTVVRGPHHRGRGTNPFRNAIDRVTSRTPVAAISETNLRRNEMRHNRMYSPPFLLA